MEFGLESDLLRSTAELYRGMSQRIYLFCLCDGTSIELHFPPRCYHHLIGLHKFPDIAGVHIDKKQNRTAVAIYNDILAGNISIYDLQQSIYYSPEVVTDRLESFLGIESLLSEEASLIYPFDSKTLGFISKIDTGSNDELALFRMELNLPTVKSYLLLFCRRVAYSDYYVPISFFCEYDDRYFRGQPIRTIANVTTRVFPAGRKKKK